mgnify:FL=1
MTIGISILLNFAKNINTNEKKDFVKTAMNNI